MKRSLLTRRTPLRSKRPTPRIKTPVGEVCLIAGCSHEARVLGKCRHHFRAELDSRARMRVLARDDFRCRSCGRMDVDVPRCPYPNIPRLQWAHITSRRFDWVRWKPYNAVTLCWRCHEVYTGDRQAWEAFVDEHVAPLRVERLRAIRERRTPERADYERWLLDARAEYEREGSEDELTGS